MDENIQNNNQPKYDGWIISDNIVKRSLAIYGHTLLGGLIIMIPIWILIFIIGLMFRLMF